MPADLVSLSRIVLAGAFVLAASVPARLAIVGIAGVSDYLDGVLARRDGPGRYGAIIDPATDRVFVVAVVATLVVEDVMTLAQCAVLMARDLATTAGVVVVRATPRLRSMRLSARWSGKVVTALQFVTLVAVIRDRSTLTWLLPVVAIASAVSIIDYGVAAWRTRTAP